MEAKNFFIQLYFFTSYLLGFGQTLPLAEKGHLPKGLTECSGMVQWAPNRLIMHNDSGNEPVLYITDTMARLQQKIPISALKNNDWEALSLDKKRGLLYIGNIGNNANRRQNLRIHKLKLEEQGDSLKVTLRGNICFTYPEQRRFPPRRRHRTYDCESMVYHGDSLYLFTKNRTKPFTGYTYQYALPTDTGHFTALRQDSFKTGTGLMPSYWVVDASYDAPRGHFALLGYDKLWLFAQVEAPHFLRGKVTEYKFNHVSQKEALVVHKNRVWIGNEEERRNSGTGVLYRSRLPFGKKDTMHLPKGKARGDSVSLLHRKVGDTLTVSLFGEIKSAIRWEVFTTEGHRVLFGTEAPHEQTNHFHIDVSNLPFGGYVLNVLLNKEPHAIPFQKPYRQQTAR